MKHLTSVLSMYTVTPYYAQVKKPNFSPPAHWFTPIRIVSFLVQVISFVLYLSSTNWRTSVPAVFFVISVVLSLLWSPLFKNKMITFAMFICIANWFFVFISVFFFSTQCGWAAAILLPELAWVGIITYVNIGVVLNNQDSFLEQEKSDVKNE